MTRQILPITFLLCLLLTGSCKEDTYVYPDVITEFIDIQTDGSGTITQLVLLITGDITGYSHAKVWTDFVLIQSTVLFLFINS